MEKVIYLISFFIGYICYSQSPESITIRYIDGAENICQSEYITVEIIVEPANQLYFYVLFKEVPLSTNEFIYSGNENVIILGDIDQTETYLLTVNDTNTSFTINVENPVNPGIDSSVTLCSSEVQTYNLFDFLEGNPDMGGTWSYMGETLTEAIVNPIEDESGIYTYTVSGTDICPDLSSQLTVNVDSSIYCPTKNKQDLDGDGVDNEADFDDDNDGILDEDEDLACVDVFDLSSSNLLIDKDFGMGLPVQDKYVVSELEFSVGNPQDVFGNEGQYNVATSTHMYNYNSESSFYTATNLIGNVDADGDIDGRYLMINMNTSSFVDAPIYIIDDLYLQKDVFYNLSLELNNLEDSGVSVNPNLLLEISDSTGNPLAFINTGDIIGGSDEWEKFNLFFTPTSTIENASFRIINKQTQIGNGNDLGIDNIVLKTLECNIDGDEFPNYLDVDSDGDGVFDAIEAGLSPNLDLDNNGVVDGGVDANGVPLAVSGGLFVVDENENGVPDYLDEEILLSINDNILNNSFGVYPNPAKESITINFDSVKGNHFNDIHIYDLNGNIVYNEHIDQEVYKINVSKLIPGIYFIASNNNRLNSKKIIIK